MVVNNGPDHVEGVPLANLTDGGGRIPWGRAANRIMYQWMRRWNIGVTGTWYHWDDLLWDLNLVWPGNPAYDRIVTPRLENAVKRRLRELKDKGIVSYPNNGVKTSGTYADWTERWLEPDWEGDIEEPVALDHSLGASRGSAGFGSGGDGGGGGGYPGVYARHMAEASSSTTTPQLPSYQQAVTEAAAESAAAKCLARQNWRSVDRSQSSSARPRAVPGGAASNNNAASTNNNWEEEQADHEFELALAASREEQAAREQEEIKLALREGQQMRLVRQVSMLDTGHGRWKEAGGEVDHAGNVVAAASAAAGAGRTTSGHQQQAAKKASLPALQRQVTRFADEPPDAGGAADEEQDDQNLIAKAVELSIQEQADDWRRRQQEQSAQLVGQQNWSWSTIEAAHSQAQHHWPGAWPPSPAASASSSNPHVPSSSSRTQQQSTLLTEPELHPHASSSSCPQQSTLLTEPELHPQPQAPSPVPTTTIRDLTTQLTTLLDESLHIGTAVRAERDRLQQHPDDGPQEELLAQRARDLSMRAEAVEDELMLAMMGRRRGDDVPWIGMGDLRDLLMGSEMWP